MNKKVTVTDGTWTKTLDTGRVPNTGEWTWYYSAFYRIMIKNLNNGDNYIVLRAIDGQTISIDSSVYNTLGTIDINS